MQQRKGRENPVTFYRLCYCKGIWSQCEIVFACPQELAEDGFASLPRVHKEVDEDKQPCSMCHYPPE